MARLLLAQKKTRERWAVERSGAFFDLITRRLSCGAIELLVQVDPAVMEALPEFTLISEIPPLLSGGRRHRSSKKALDLQLQAYKLYIQGNGVSAIARKLHKPVSTVQRALVLVDEFVGLPRRIPPPLEDQMLLCKMCGSGAFCYKHDLTHEKAEGVDVDQFVEQTDYPYQCPGCAGMIDSDQHARAGHRECAYRVRAEAA